MADGRDDRVARGPKAGRKLHYDGDYSGEDMSITYAHLNARVPMNEENHGNRINNCEPECRGRTGCILKEPLS